MARGVLPGDWHGCIALVSLLVVMLLPMASFKLSLMASASLLLASISSSSMLRGRMGMLFRLGGDSVMKEAASSGLGWCGRCYAL